VVDSTGEVTEKEMDHVDHLSLLAVPFVVWGDIGDIGEAEVRGEAMSGLLGGGCVDLSRRTHFHWFTPSSTDICLHKVRVRLREGSIVVSGVGFLGRRRIAEAIWRHHFLLAAHLLDGLRLVLVDVWLSFIEPPKVPRKAVGDPKLSDPLGRSVTGVSEPKHHWGPDREELESKEEKDLSIYGSPIALEAKGENNPDSIPTSTKLKSAAVFFVCNSLLKLKARERTWTDIR
jgi:hypothetical protein